MSCCTLAVQAGSKTTSGLPSTTSVQWTACEVPAKAPTEELFWNYEKPSKQRWSVPLLKTQVSAALCTALFISTLSNTIYDCTLPCFKKGTGHARGNRSFCWATYAQQGILQNFWLTLITQCKTSLPDLVFNFVEKKIATRTCTLLEAHETPFQLLMNFRDILKYMLVFHTFLCLLIALPFTVPHLP